MPVLESTDHLMSRSALRHRPIEANTGQQGKRPFMMAGVTPVAQRASRQHPKYTGADEEVDERERTTEDGKKARSGHASAAARPVGAPTKQPPKTPRMKRRGLLRGHPLLYLGIGMVAMLALWTLLTMAVSWWNTTMDDFHYGRPRTSQVDAVVGHNDSTETPSHFIAINLHGHIEVIEFPAGDGAHARIYLGPQLYGAGSDLVPVTLSFVDVNSRHQPDMIVHFQQTQIIYINDRGGFRPATPDELHAVEHYMRQHGH